jgi:hypothetical protein
MTAAAQMRAAAEALRAGHPPIPPILATAVADLLDDHAEWLASFGGVSPFEHGGPQPAEYRHAMALARAVHDANQDQEG